MKRRCQELVRSWRSRTTSEGFGRNFLEIANVPAVCARGHENDVLVGRILGIEQLVSVESLDLQLGLIDKLHRSPIGGIEDRLQMVAMIHDPNMHARLLLLADSPHKSIVCESDELFAESFGSTRFQRHREVTPCQRVMARYRRSREFFNGTWHKSVSIEVYLREVNRRRRLGDRQNAGCNREARSFDEPMLNQPKLDLFERHCSGYDAFHSPPLRATATSFPSTTPQATLMRA